MWELDVPSLVVGLLLGSIIACIFFTLISTK